MGDLIPSMQHVLLMHTFILVVVDLYSCGSIEFLWCFQSFGSSGSFVPYGSSGSFQSFGVLWVFKGLQGLWGLQGPLGLQCPSGLWGLLGSLGFFGVFPEDDL